MSPKNLANSRRQRPRTPGVKAGLELMVQLGGIQVLGTSQQPYYYFPPDARLARGVERCSRCVAACGANAACNVRPFIRVGINLWKARKCHYCTIFPAELEGDRCSLEDCFYRFNSTERRLMRASETGELIATLVSEEYDLNEKVRAHGNIIAAPITPPLKQDVAVLPAVPQPTTPELKSAATMSSFGLLTPAGTPSQKTAEREKKTREPHSPSNPQQPQTVEQPAHTFPAIASSAATVFKPRLATAKATASEALPTPAVVKNKPDTVLSVSLVPVWTNKPSFEQEAPPTPSLANFTPPAAASRPTIAPATTITISTSALPVPFESQYTPRTSSFSFDPVTQLVATRRPAAVLTAVSDALTAEVVALDRLNVSIVELRRLIAAKEEEQAAQLRKIDTYRNAIDDALSAIEAEQNSLRSLRARLVVSL